MCNGLNDGPTKVVLQLLLSNAFVRPMTDDWITVTGLWKDSPVDGMFLTLTNALTYKM